MSLSFHLFFEVRAFRVENKLALYAMIAVLTLTNLHVIKLIYKKHHPTEPDDGSDPGNALHF